MHSPRYCQMQKKEGKRGGTRFDDMKEGEGKYKYAKRGKKMIFLVLRSGDVFIMMTKILEGRLFK